MARGNGGSDKPIFSLGFEGGSCVELSISSTAIN